jgi:hypothetical protein
MNDLEKNRIKMMNNFDIATELYLKCKNSGCNDILSPINWLYNQTVLIKAYNQFKNKHKNDNFLLLFIQKNEYTDYMDFMCENYPVGFGDRLKEHIKNGKDFNGAEIYLELIKNN